MLSWLGRPCSSGVLHTFYLLHSFWFLYQECHQSPVYNTFFSSFLRWPRLTGYLYDLSQVLTFPVCGIVVSFLKRLMSMGNSFSQWWVSQVLNTYFSGFGFSRKKLLAYSLSCLLEFPMHIEMWLYTHTPSIWYTTSSYIANSGNQISGLK